MGTTVGAIQLNPDDRYDRLTGEARLKALESALSPGREWSGHPDERPEKRAGDWMEKSGSCIRLLGDFESTPDGAAGFPGVWEGFGLTHSPKPEKTEVSGSRDLKDEYRRVLALIAKLPEKTLAKAIHGLSRWLSIWGDHVVAQPEGINVWLRLWSLAVATTNVDRKSEGGEGKIDALNPPAGQLMDVFLAACPNLEETPRPFDDADGAPAGCGRHRDR